jgi:hypothetical protein
MSGFENLPQAIDEGLAQRPPTPEELAFTAEKLADERALGLVLRDASLSESFITAKGLQEEWDRMDNLYRAKVPVKNWPNSNVPKAHLSMPLAMEVIEALLPQIHMAFFSDRQPFILRAKGKTKPEAARANAKILTWAVIESGFKEEIRKMLKSTLQYGQCLGKWGWRREKRSRKQYRRANDGSIEAAVLESNEPWAYPTFEFVDMRNALVDAGARSHDVRTAAKHVIFQQFIDANELDELRKDPTYKNIPSREELKEILGNLGEPTADSLSGVKNETWRENKAERPQVPTSSDPLSQNLELLEWQSAGRIITVLQRKIVIRNDENEFGEKTFLSCAFIDVLNAFHGFGVTKLVEGDQRLQTGVINKWLDQYSLAIDQPLKRGKDSRGPNTQTELMAPGKILSEGVEPINVPVPSTDALNIVALADTRAHRRVGANSGPDMPNQALRTAEGVQAFTSGVQTRLQYFVEQFTDLVFIPALCKFLELCKDNLSPDQINSILTEEEGKAYEGDVLDIYNAQCSIEVLTSTKLAAIRAMSQLMPMFMQMFGAEPVQASLTQQGKKVDYVEFVKQSMDLAGWDASNFIVEMTPEDQQRAMMMNPAVQKAQADQQLLAQKHENALELTDAQGMAKAGVKVIDHTLKMSEPKEPATPLPNQKKPGAKK